MTRPIIVANPTTATPILPTPSMIIVEKSSESYVALYVIITPPVVLRCYVYFLINLYNKIRPMIVANPTIATPNFPNPSIMIVEKSLAE